MPKRGRPKILKDMKKDYSIRISFDKDTYAQIAKYANKVNLTLTEYGRRGVLEKLFHDSYAEEVYEADHKGEEDDIWD